MPPGARTITPSRDLTTLPPTDQDPPGGRGSKPGRRARGLPHKVWRDPGCVAALGFGAGAAPYAPGTAGTLVAIPLYLLIAPLPRLWYAAAVIALFATGIWLCGRAQRVLAVHDHPAIVWDEIVGYLLAMFMAPPGWIWVAIGFALFRVFDIWKPFPIRIIDRTMHDGLGIMLDDALAGIYAWAGVQILALFFS